MSLESKVIKGFEFKSFGGRSEYDWDTLLDGKVRHVTGYECKDASFALMARNQGKRRNRTVQIGKHPEGGIVLQAKPASQEQIAKWEASEAQRQAKADEKAALATA